MQDWQEYYNSRKCTAAEAVDLIQSGDHVVIGHNVAEPQALISAMVENHDAYRGVHIHHMQFQKARCILKFQGIKPVSVATKEP